MTLFCLQVTVLTANIYSTNFNDQLNIFCSLMQVKNVCTKENLELGEKIFQERFNEIQKEAILLKTYLQKAERIRKIQQMKERKMLQMLRERFLDRHI